MEKGQTISLYSVRRTNRWAIRAAWIAESGELRLEYVDYLVRSGIIGL
jgi:hypothetical protein